MAYLKNKNTGQIIEVESYGAGMLEEWEVTTNQAQIDASIAEKALEAAKAERLTTRQAFINSKLNDIIVEVVVPNTISVNLKNDIQNVKNEIDTINAATDITDLQTIPVEPILLSSS